MNKKDLLFRLADSQQGYFTCLQAEKCGFSRSHFHQYIRSGEWRKEFRGIYRLARYPLTDYRPELVLWSLWSRNKRGEIQGIWSHETALDIYDLCDVMPAKMHMTVPKSFRTRASQPPVLILHYTDLPLNAIRSQHGYLITTPLRTLIDIEEEGVLSLDLLLQALSEGLRQGVFSRREIEATPEAYSLRVLLNKI